RSAGGMIDVSPLYKYEIYGPDASKLVNRIMTRNIDKCKINQVMYTPWCDEDGKVIDDGTITKLEENRYRITAADPSLRWFQDCGYGMQAEVIDVSEELAALAVQGPKSLQIINATVDTENFDNLKYYWATHTKIDDFPITLTRTGYTGDLGFELWVNPKYAEKLWDILMSKGKSYGLAPIGLVALDMLRVEAGYLMIEVDYISTFKAIIEEQKSSPFEIGLGWTVDLEGSDFIGKKALVKEKKSGIKWDFIGLDINWFDLEKKYSKGNLPPQVPGQVSRNPLPLYKQGRQVGQATSITFSPTLKKYIAIGTIESSMANLGDEVDIEITVEYARKTAKAKLVKPSFFNPKRKRAVKK
ncbi:MAG: aminomethyltransferase family protein, partial [Chloroflexota bacterium]